MATVPSGAGPLRQLTGQLTGALGAVFVLSASCSAAILAVSLYNMELYNRVLNARNLGTHVALSIGLVFAMAVYGVLEYLRSSLFVAIGARLARRLSLPTLLAASRQADATSRPAEQAIRDLNELRLFVSGTSLPVLFELVWCPIYLVALFCMHWAYGCFALVSGILIGGFNLAADLLAKEPLHQANEASAKAFAEIAVAVRHAEAIEAMGMFPAIARRWQASQHAMLTLMYRGGRLTKALAAAAKSYRMLVTAGTVGLGLVLAVNGLASSGSMLAANILVARLILPFEQIVGSWRQWVNARAAYRRIAEVLSETATEKRGTMPLPCPQGRLVVDRLVYLPPGSDRPVIRGISFVLEPGEVLGIIGPSAAGKSTLARLILGIAQPTAGGIYLDGSNTYLWEREDFGRHVGYVPQNVALLDGTVGDNIARMRDAEPADVIAAARRTGLHEMLAALPHGYDTPVSETGFALSGGQRQRIALARALFGDPRLLILDEPNANLDQDGEAALIAAVRTAKRGGTGVVMIAHRPSVMAVADKILVLKDGVVDRFGSRESVLAVSGGSAAALPPAHPAEPGQRNRRGTA
jgi:ATP-binding cassette, subfamily C, bacterial